MLPHSQAEAPGRGGGWGMSWETSGWYNHLQAASMFTQDRSAYCCQLHWTKEMSGCICLGSYLFITVAWVLLAWWISPTHQVVSSYPCARSMYRNSTGFCTGETIRNQACWWIHGCGGISASGQPSRFITFDLFDFHENHGTHSQYAQHRSERLWYQAVLCGSQTYCRCHIFCNEHILVPWICQDSNVPFKSFTKSHVLKSDIVIFM